MAEPRLLQVGNEETTAKEKGESGLSSAQVGTEAKTVEKASEEPKGVYVANENVVSDNSKALRTSQEAPRGQYVASTERLGGFERSAGEKGVVNTITVEEVKALIKQYGGSGDTYTKEEINHIVETMRKGLYQEVDTTEYPTLEDFLDSDGEEGIIYLYPVGNEGNNYYQYIWETTKEWISLGTTVVDLSQYAKLTLLAPIYDSTATYSVGAKCVYNGKLYTCSTAITQAEDFDATHWTEISVSSGFVDLDSASFERIIAPSSTTLSNELKTKIINKGVVLVGNPYFRFADENFSYLTLYPTNNSFGGSRYIGKFIGSSNTARIFEGYYAFNNNSNEIYSYAIVSEYIQGLGCTNLRITGSGSIRIGGKAIPAYPTTTTKQYKFVQKVGGNLDYVEDNDFTPASVSLSDGGTISDTTLQANIQYHRPIVLNGFTCYFSCDDGTNYQYTSMRYDANANKNHINVITINKSTWVATFHTSDLTLN